MSKRKKTKSQHTKWHYKNLTFVFLGLVATYYLSRQDYFHQIIVFLSGYGYITAFFAGALFCSTFTVGLGALILFSLEQELHIFNIVFVAAAGGVFADLVIFRFIRNNLSWEINYLFDHHLNGRHLRKLFKTKYFSWSLPVIGALIIASPFPDELGVSLLSLSKMSTIKFAFISFIMNSIGVFLVVSASFLL